MKKFLLDYISTLLNDECNSFKICIRYLDQRSNSIDMYQENSLPPTIWNVDRNRFASETYVCLNTNFVKKSLINDNNLTPKFETLDVNKVGKVWLDGKES